MNIEALSLDLHAVLQKHGFTGEIERTLQQLLLLSASPGGLHLFDRYAAGATLFAIDDTCSSVIGRASAPMSGNARLLMSLVTSLSTSQLGHVLQILVAQIQAIKTPCNCPKCLARRAETPLFMSPQDKGALEAAFTRADDTNCRSKH